MVHIPTRGDVPVRLGPSIRNVPDYGPSRMSRQPYTDPVQFELERERVLNRTWLLAARSEQVAGAGDWITFESHGETVVIARQPEGHLAAFHNVCMHRGPAIVTEWKGCGAKQFTCPYHGWTYDLTGKVKGVPERIDFDPEHLRGLRTPQVAVDEWGGWIWVNLAGPDEAPSLQSWIGEEIMVDLGRFRMEDMVLHEVIEWDVPVSYKAVVDGFNEIYHTAELHHVGKRVGQVGPRHELLDGQRPQLHVLRAAAPDARPTRRRTGIITSGRSATTSCSRTPCSTAIPSTSRCSTRSRSTSIARSFLCWELVYPGDEADPEYAEYRERMQRHWDHLKVVVGEDIDIYQAARADQAVERVHPEHPQRARVQDRPLSRDHVAHDPGLNPVIPA